MNKGGYLQSDETAELLHAIQCGSSGAFVKLSEKFAPLISSEVMRYASGLDGDDLEDLKQGALISLYRAALAYRFDKGVTFGLYAKICVINGIADTLRYLKKTENDLSMEELAEGEHPASEDITEMGALDNDYILKMRSSIERELSKLEFDIFCLYLEGYSYSEIGKKLGKTAKSVDNALRRVKDKLKKIF